MRLFSGSLLGDMDRDGVEGVARSALRLMGVQMQQDISQQRRILEAVGQNKNKTGVEDQAQSSNSAYINYFISN